LSGHPARRGSRSIGALQEDDPVIERLVGGREPGGDERAVPDGAA